MLHRLYSVTIISVHDVNNQRSSHIGVNLSHISSLSTPANPNTLVSKVCIGNSPYYILNQSA